MKRAYPQGFQSWVAAPHNVQKWADTLTKIVQLKSAHPDYSFSDVLDFMTKDWDVNEKNDFQNWVKYYQGHNQDKYKTAQFNIDILKATLPKSKEDIFQELNQEVPSQLNSKELIDKKIKALISRLNAAEKILTDPQVQQEMPETTRRKILEELHSVKRQIQLAPLRNVRSSLLEDLVYRRGEALSRNGFKKEGNFIKQIITDKFAQEEPKKAPEGNKEPSKNQTPKTPPPSHGAPSKPPMPSPPHLTPKPGGAPSLPKPPAPQNLPTAAPSAHHDDGEEAINNLIRGMNLDEQDINDVVDIDDDPISEMHIIAQLAPEPMPPITDDPTETLQPPDENLEIEEPGDLTDLPPEDADALLDAALNNITIDDLVNKLETAANILRKRELPRILSVVDLYMDQLQFSSFFPQIGEAQAKSLDANQYQLTRVEEVLSKIRGAMTSPNKVSLEEENEPNPQLEGMKNKLKNQEELEKIRKEKRKQEELNKGNITGPQPITNVEQDLNQPVELPPTPPALPQAPPV